MLRQKKLAQNSRVPRFMCHFHEAMKWNYNEQSKHNYVYTLSFHNCQNDWWPGVAKWLPRGWFGGLKPPRNTKLRLSPEPLTRGPLPSDPRSLCPQLNLFNPPPEQNSWVRHWRYCATSQKVSGSIPGCVTGDFFRGIWQVHVLGSTQPFRNEYQGIPGGKDGRCVGLTTLPP
jgi:hypothetical protein